MNCECFEKVNGLLEKQGQQLDLLFAIDGGSHALIIPTIPLDGHRKKKAPRLVAGYCPFCGKNLRVKDADGGGGSYP